MILGLQSGIFHRLGLLLLFCACVWSAAVSEIDRFFGAVRASVNPEKCIGRKLEWLKFDNVNVAHPYITRTTKEIARCKRGLCKNDGKCMAVIWNVSILFNFIEYYVGRARYLKLDCAEVIHTYGGIHMRRQCSLNLYIDCCRIYFYILQEFL